MYVTKITLLASLAMSVIAVPAVHPKQKRALQFQTFDEFQISDGVAGNAMAEIQDKFPVRNTGPTPPPASSRLLNNSSDGELLSVHKQSTSRHVEARPAN